MGHTRRMLSLSVVLSACLGMSCHSESKGEGKEDVPTMIERVKSAVVNVDVISSTRRDRRPTQMGTGSGFFIDAKGLVLTNHHVVDNATSVRVRMDDGKSFKADVVGVDPLADVALLQVETPKEGVPFVKMGESSKLRVGQSVVAIGNPFGLASSVSKGIVSALAREELMGPYDEFIQIDAPINPGNSGGPLFNMRGEVVGMNAASINGGPGIGFAIPSEVLKTLLPQLMEKGVVERGWLGVEMEEITPDLAEALGMEGKMGVLVTALTERGPGEKSGLKLEDVITRVDDREITSTGMFSRILGFGRPKTVLKLEIYREGSAITIEAVLGKRPDFERFAEKSMLPSKKGLKPKEKGGIGLTLQSLRGRNPGVLVTSVSPSSPADMARIVEGDIITELDRHPVFSAAEVVGALTDKPADSLCLVRIRKSNGQETLRAIRIPMKAQSDS